ncbi:very short patch repair endonuclease [Tateyamaria omphalii]|uniref:Very short patch repair endonuclease n=1 Tax=Tateyamaria omphalii TaxID=299262 RepID=A0A1P8MTD9_9RHOB|nr:very short patch repair endonuclease [Tateyamaria omphalii]
MTDIVNSAIRSRMMAANTRRNTKPELLVRRHLHARGLRFRVDVRRLPGSPDVVLARHNAAIFVHGCFWHRHEGCRHATIPKTNILFWKEKFARNIERDRNATTALMEMRFRVAVIWECALGKGVRAENLCALASWVREGEDYLELPRRGG